jgi:hypothetical protein
MFLKDDVNLRITLEEKMEVIRRMEGVQSRTTVCRGLNMAPSTVTTIMKNADNITKIKETARGRTDTTLRYSCGPVIGKMEQLLSLWVDETNEKIFLPHKVLSVIKQRVCLMIQKKKNAAMTLLEQAKTGSVMPTYLYFITE